MRIIPAPMTAALMNMPKATAATCAAMLADLREMLFMQ
jgi:hypothetical protein